MNLIKSCLYSTYFIISYINSNIKHKFTKYKKNLVIFWSTVIYLAKAASDFIFFICRSHGPTLLKMKYLDGMLFITRKLYHRKGY